MLVNVRSDREFQRYCDRMEQSLHTKLMPTLTAAIRIQVNTNAARAKDYSEKRATPELVNHYQHIYSDQYNAVTASTTKEDTRGGFLDSQLAFLEREGASKITGISTNLAQDIN